MNKIMVELTWVTYEHNKLKEKGVQVEDPLQGQIRDDHETQILCNINREKHRINLDKLLY